MTPEELEQAFKTAAPAARLCQSCNDAVVADENDLVCSKCLYQMNTAEPGANRAFYTYQQRLRQQAEAWRDRARSAEAEGHGWRQLYERAADTRDDLDVELYAHQRAHQRAMGNLERELDQVEQAGESVGFKIAVALGLGFGLGYLFGRYRGR